MRRAAAVVAVLALSSSTGCADPNPHAEIKVRLDDYSIRLAPQASGEGTVKMFVDNVGREAHSLYFVRAKHAADLPTAADGTVDLSKVQVADQLEPFGTGRYRIAPELFAGPLVVFCNLVTKGPDGQPISHFQRGMSAELTIRSED